MTVAYSSACLNPNQKEKVILPYNNKLDTENFTDPENGMFNNV